MANRRSGQLGLGDAYKQKTGEVLALKDIDGVGETLAKRIAAATGTRNPKKVAEYSPGQLADKVSGVSRQLAQRIVNRGGGSKHTSKGGGGTNVLNTQTTSEMRTLPVGDFQVDLAKQDSAEAKHDFRSQNARRTDRNERAPITTDLDKWKENKAAFDFPGVDTPASNPEVRPKDFTRGGPFETSEQASESATETKSGPQSWPDKEDPMQHTGMNFAGEQDTGLSPRDYETEVETPGKDIMGRKPSSAFLSEPAFQGLASGEAADMSFVEAEKKRTKEEKDLTNMMDVELMD